MRCVPTGTPTISARLFTQLSLWYLATSCPVAVRWFIGLLFTSKRRQYPNLRLPSSPVKTKANISLRRMEAANVEVKPLMFDDQLFLRWKFVFNSRLTLGSSPLVPSLLRLGSRSEEWSAAGPLSPSWTWSAAPAAGKARLWFPSDLSV